VLDFGVKSTADDCTENDGSSSALLRSMSDVLIGYSTQPGFGSHRNVYLGTWYIQAVCEVFMEHAWNTDVEDMLKLVSLSAFIIIMITVSGLCQFSLLEGRSGSAAILRWGV